MSAEPQTTPWDDCILQFQLESTAARGRIVRLDHALEAILKQHDYPHAVHSLVAEMALLTALIGNSIKLRWKLSLQAQSNGPVRMIATDYYAPQKSGDPAQIRAYASFDADRLDTSNAMANVGEGYFAVLIDQGQGSKPYQGITPLVRTSLADAAASYFAQSEQLPTRFLLHYGLSQSPSGPQEWRGGGIMLQQLPKSEPKLSDEGASSGPAGLLAAEDCLDGSDLADWERANFHLDTVEELELIGPSVTSAQLAYRLFHEEGVRVFETQAIEFGCSCSEERVRNSLSIYSQKDIEKMTTPDGRVTADCQFCGAHYTLDPKTVGFDAPDTPDAPSES